MRPLSIHRAFVVHLAADAGDALAGAVEHVLSGRSLTFSDANELARCLCELREGTTTVLDERAAEREPPR